MKKKFTAIIAMIMVLLMGTTVLAAPSVDKESADKEILKAEVGSISGATAKTPDGNAVAIAITEVGSTDIVESAKTNAAYFATQVEKDSTPDILGIVEVLAGIPDGYISIDVTFQCPDIRVGDKVIVLHQKQNGQWETVASKILKNGEIVATFTSFSPVAIVKVNPTESIKDSQIKDTEVDIKDNDISGSTTGNSGDTKGDGINGNTSSEPVSPLTGELISVVVLLVVLCGAGILFLGKKVIAR